VRIVNVPSYLFLKRRKREKIKLDPRFFPDRFPRYIFGKEIQICYTRNDENNGFSLFIHPFYPFPSFLPSVPRGTLEEWEKKKKNKCVGKVIGQVLIKLDRIFRI